MRPIGGSLSDLNMTSLLAKSMTMTMLMVMMMMVRVAMMLVRMSMVVSVIMMMMVIVATSIAAQLSFDQFRLEVLNFIF